MVISRKEKKKKSKRWIRRSQTNSKWNIIQRSLFETTLTSLVWAFTIIYFPTPSQPQYKPNKSPHKSKIDCYLLKVLI